MLTSQPQKLWVKPSLDRELVPFFWIISSVLALRPPSFSAPIMEWAPMTVFMVKMLELGAQVSAVTYIMFNYKLYT